jgi:hypothetical protein
VSNPLQQQQLPQQRSQSAPSGKAAFPRPKAGIAKSRGHLSLLITRPPIEGETEVRYLTRHAHSTKLYVLRRITGAFTTVRIPTTGIREITVRYIDPYDTSRESAPKILTPPTRKPKHPRRP